MYFKSATGTYKLKIEQKESTEDLYFLEDRGYAIMK